MKPKSKPKRKVKAFHENDLVMTTPGSITILIRERETLRHALHDLLRFYDTLSGHVGEHGVGWTYADIKRLEEIQELVKVKG